ncbi:MAG TPA: hypothetical protein PK771_03105, partial [Spirochaetota bacterium]|nr:hypothetical protein [Spirochaetota bacterium]
FANIENIKSSVLIIPDGKDPDDYFKKHSLSDFIEIEKGKLSGFDFLIEYKMKGINREDYSSLIGVLNFLFEYILLWTNEIIRDSLIDKLVSKLNMYKGIISKEFNNFKNRGDLKQAQKNEYNANMSNSDILIRELNEDEKNELDLLLVLSNISNFRELIKQCGFDKIFFYYDIVKSVFIKYFCEDFYEKKNILDLFDDDNYRNYVNNRVFSDELKSDENILRNNAIDRMSRVMSRFYERKIAEIKESIRLAELYKDDDFVKELMEDRDVLAKETIKLKKLQELKK